MHEYVESVVYCDSYLQSFVLELLKNSFFFEASVDMPVLNARECQADERKCTVSTVRNRLMNFQKKV